MLRRSTGVPGVRCASRALPVVADGRCRCRPASAQAMSVYWRAILRAPPAPPAPPALSASGANSHLRLRTHLPCARRSLQTLPSASYQTIAEPRVARHSFPHHWSARGPSKPSLHSIMGSVAQTRDSTGNSHNHDHDHDHDHDHSHHSHSHSPFHLHHHHHDNAYLTSSNKNDPGVRITRIGLLSNLGMAIAKFAGGWAFNSKAMVADAWHSIADLASDILTLATVSVSLKPPSDRFPLGFGKIESLGSLGVSSMLLIGGCYMGWESAITLYAHFDPETAHHILEHIGHGHSHSHSHSAADLGIPSMHAAWLAGGTILIKEWLYHASKLEPVELYT